MSDLRKCITVLKRMSGDRYVKHKVYISNIKIAKMQCLQIYDVVCIHMKLLHSILETSRLEIWFSGQCYSLCSDEDLHLISSIYVAAGHDPMSLYKPSAVDKWKQGDC